MLDRVIRVVCDVFDVNEDEVSLNTTKDDLEEWDSMKQLELINSLENEFKVKLTMDEMIAMDSISKIINILGSK